MAEEEGQVIVPMIGIGVGAVSGGILGKYAGAFIGVLGGGLIGYLIAAELMKGPKKVIFE